jgi:hypothetical protein
MKVIDPSRIYELSAGNSLAFVQMHDGRIVRDGTTNEEVLDVLIDRVTDGYQRLPCQESIRAVYFLKEALAALRKRTESRRRLKVDGTLQPHYSQCMPPDEAVGGMSLFDVRELDVAPN